MWLPWGVHREDSALGLIGIEVAPKDDLTVPGTPTVRALVVVVFVIVEAFRKEFNNQHAILSNKLENLAAAVRGEKTEDIAREANVRLPIPIAVLRSVNYAIQETLEAAGFARDWDYEAHLRAFDMEAERVAGARS